MPNLEIPRNYEIGRIRNCKPNNINELLHNNNEVVSGTVQILDTRAIYIFREFDNTRNFPRIIDSINFLNIDIDATEISEN